MTVIRSRTDDTQRTPGGHVLRGEEVDPTPSRRSRATLRTLDDVAAELARLYRRAERGQIPASDASRLTYMLTSLAKVLEAARQPPLPNTDMLEHDNMLLPPSLADLYQAMQTLRMDRLKETLQDEQQPVELGPFTSTGSDVT